MVSLEGLFLEQGFGFGYIVYAGIGFVGDREVS